MGSLSSEDLVEKSKSHQDRLRLWLRLLMSSLGRFVAFPDCSWAIARVLLALFAVSLSVVLGGGTMRLSIFVMRSRFLMRDVHDRLREPKLVLAK